MRSMGMFDVLAPVLLIVGAIAVAALIYLGITAMKDRRAEKRSEKQAKVARVEKQDAPAHFKK
ncbi:hypothetical protein [Collinsella provencensis]|uniref:hypothetical protein n=1 Tax=Collinsella provencensis TaxID=1937461 RepID=UPI000C81C2ED|nr:hypothetical protein [Collinsella provencensis]